MMGAQLVSRVFTSWSHLPDRPFRLLCHMALVVKDATKEPTYWGGRDAMAQALGLAPSPAAHQSVKRAMRTIVASGAARIVYHGHAGKRTEYRLTLGTKPVDKPADDDDSTDRRGSLTDPLRGSVNDPHRGSLSDPAGGHSATPLGTTLRSTEEYGEEDILSPKVTTRGRGPGVDKASDVRLALVRSRADAEATA